MFHDEYSPTSGFFQMFRWSRISKFLIIKSFSLVLNDESNLIIQKSQFNINGFFGVLFISMNNGIAYTLCNWNQDIPINVIIDFEFFPGIINEALYDGDVLN